jgi:hypothetical protein
VEWRLGRREPTGSRQMLLPSEVQAVSMQFVNDDGERDTPMAALICESEVGREIGTGAAAAPSAAMDEKEMAASADREKDEDMEARMMISVVWWLGRVGCRDLLSAPGSKCSGNGMAILGTVRLRAQHGTFYTSGESPPMCSSSAPSASRSVPRRGYKRIDGFDRRTRPLVSRGAAWTCHIRPLAMMGGGK